MGGVYPEMHNTKYNNPSFGWRSRSNRPAEPKQYRLYVKCEHVQEWDITFPVDTEEPAVERRWMLHKQNTHTHTHTVVMALARGQQVQAENECDCSVMCFGVWCRGGGGRCFGVVVVVSRSRYE